MPPKERYLLDNFRLTTEMWNQMYEHQKGLCGVCHQPLADKVVNIDHDHRSGLVRGLACFHCNKSIRENFTVEFVRQVLEYLLAPPATAALGAPHFGLPGRVGTETRRKLIKKLRTQGSL